MAIFKGAGVAMITPFHEDKSVNYEELGRMLEAQVQGHTDAIIVCGTTGEPVTMSMEERTEVIRFTVEKIAHRIPVIAGTGANCTQTAVELSMKAQELGVDGLLVVTPFKILFWFFNYVYKTRIHKRENFIISILQNLHLLFCQFFCNCFLFTYHIIKSKC